MQTDPRDDVRRSVPRGAGRRAGFTLVELLVAMTIAFILTSMILLSWFALQDSYSHTTRAGEARERARDAMSRVVREVRDAQAPGGPAIVAGTNWQIDFYTTFNAPGDEDAGYGDLHLTRILYESSTQRLLRLRDTDGDGSLDRTTVLADHVVNPLTRPLFRYWTYDTTGHPVRVDALTTTNRAQVYAVEVRLVVDLNPGDPPEPVYVRSTAQLRNARPF